MTASLDTSSEDDVLYQFAMSYQHPDARELDDFVRLHPSHAGALTALAIELALEQASLAGESALEDCAQADVEAEAMLSRAMSRFQNRLYAVRSTKTAATSEDDATSLLVPRDLFGWRSRDEMTSLGAKLGVSQLFLKRIRDREIRADTLTSGFVGFIAQVLNESQDSVLYHFAGRAQVGAHQYFKSLVAPAAGRQLTFEEAVRNSGLTTEQQARLLAL